MTILLVRVSMSGKGSDGEKVMETSGIHGRISSVQ